MRTGGRDYLVVVYGQSFAIGINDLDAPPFNTTPLDPDRLLMPGAPAGLYPRKRPVLSYEPLRERKEDRISETICAEAGVQILRDLDARGETGSRLVMATVGKGGHSFGYFAPGKPRHEEHCALIARCSAVSQASGREMNVLCVIFLQGQRDSGLNVSRGERLVQIAALQRSLEQATRDVTQQTDDVPLVHTDPGNSYAGDGDAWRIPAVALAAEDAASGMPTKHVNAGAMYAHEHSPKPHRGVHPTVDGYRSLGAQIGRAIVRHRNGLPTVAKVRSWRLIERRTIEIGVRLPENGRATIDWSDRIVRCRKPFLLPAGGGWSARDRASRVDDDPMTVADVQVGEDPTTFRLTLSREPRGGLEIGYANCVTRRRTHGGRARGVCRSSVVVAELPSHPYAVHDWLYPAILT